ncbi:MAG: 2-dehydropantoate 2-reductase [Syntrophobacteraceae bacterium]
MKIAIMGTGGVGGYYGGLLALSGHEVTFIARGAHLEAIRGKGLQVRSVHGDFRVSPAVATDKPSDVGPVDLVIFSTKTYHTDAAARAIRPMIGGDTTVVSLQNGVDSAERIGAAVGIGHMLGGVTWLSAAIEAPGIIGQYSQFRRVALGEFNGQSTPRLDAVGDALQAAGATVELNDNILKVLWTKFAFIAPVAAIGCLTRVTFGEFRDVPETRATLAEAIGEVAAVAKASGVMLDDDVVEKTLAFIDNSAAVIKTSMQRDMEYGKPAELESLVGVVARMGAQHNVPTPVMRFAYAMLKPAALMVRQG